MKMISAFAAFSSAVILLTGCTAADQGNASSGGSEPAAATTAAVTDAKAVVTTEPVQAEKSLVTLGDSIAFGYGMEDPDKQRYSAIISQALTERDGISWHDYNYALSGDDSSDLLRRLQKGRAVHLPSADKIIVNIGSNNLLGVYSDYVMEQVDLDDIDIETLSEEQITEMQKDIEEAMSDEATVRAELEKRIDENLVQLESDLEDIYTCIRERNPEADLYVLNIYNPYRGVTETIMPGSDENFGEYAQRQIDRANAILSAFEEKHADLIPVDVAAAFAACDPVPIAGETAAELPVEVESDSPFADMEYIDPHPNEAGQKLIADTVLEKMGI